MDPLGLGSLGHRLHPTFPLLLADDNQLVSLPFSMGGMLSLQELTVSANDLEDVPPSIGLLRHLRSAPRVEPVGNGRSYHERKPLSHLRRVHVAVSLSWPVLFPSFPRRSLNIDENFLSMVPPELGSCLQLTLLSLRR